MGQKRVEPRDVSPFCGPQPHARTISPPMIGTPRPTPDAATRSFQTEKGRLLLGESKTPSKKEAGCGLHSPPIDAAAAAAHVRRLFRVPVTLPPFLPALRRRRGRERACYSAVDLPSRLPSRVNVDQTPLFSSASSFLYTCTDNTKLIGEKNKAQSGFSKCVYVVCMYGI